MDIKLNARTSDLAMLIALTTLGQRYGDFELCNWSKHVRRQIVNQLGTSEVTLWPDEQKVASSEELEAGKDATED